MPAGKLTVDPYLCNKIRTLKVQNITVALQLFGICVNGSVIPNVFVAGFVTNAAGWGFIGKGHANCPFCLKIAVPLFPFTNVAVIKGEIPDSVQVLPVFTDKLRSGIIFHITLHMFLPHLFTYITVAFETGNLMKNQQNAICSFYFHRIQFLLYAKTIFFSNKISFAFLQISIRKGPSFAIQLCRSSE